MTATKRGRRAILRLRAKVVHHGRIGQRRCGLPYQLGGGLLGQMYLTGTGVPQNIAEAVKWFRKAADQGRPAAQNYIGVRYALGQGVGRDVVQAYMWFSLTAARGWAPAAGNRDNAAKELSPADLARAKQLVQQWRPKGP